MRMVLAEQAPFYPEFVKAFRRRWIRSRWADFVAEDTDLTLAIGLRVMF